MTTASPKLELELELAHDELVLGGGAQLASRCRRGELVRIARGVYVNAATWAKLDADQRFLARIRAIDSTSRAPLLFSHASAAALWQLPWLGAWPERIQITDVAATGGRATAQLQRHCVDRFPQELELDGLRCTSLARTVVDVAATRSFAQGVLLADAALAKAGAGADNSALLQSMRAEVEALPIRHGSVRSATVVEFADVRSESPAESLSRVTLRRLDLPAPILQQPFPKSAGGHWYVDFWWPELNLIGECDGRGKYGDEPTKTSEELYQEKLREDELRSGGRAFVRWGWREAGSPLLLMRRFRDHGVMVTQRGLSATERRIFGAR